MKRHIYTPYLAILLVMLGLASPGRADTSKFDSGNKGTSALGQLEDIAGQKVDRSPGVSTIDTYKKTIILPQKTVAKPKVNPSASMEAMVTGMVVGSLLQAVFSDNSQQAANEAAARAMAEAEQKRIAEEQRKQRILAADRLRDAWDQRDMAISDTLGDAFSLPGQGQGTNFFSSPVASAAPPVDLGGSAGTVAPSGKSAPNVPSVSMPPAPVAETNAFQERLVKEGAGFAQEVAIDAAKGAATELALDLLPKTTAANVGMMLDYKERFKEWSDNLFNALEPNRLVRAATGDTEAYGGVMEELGKVQRQAVTLAVPNNPFSSSEMELAYKALNHQEITAEEKKGIFIDRVKGFFSDKLQDRMLSGLS